MFRLLTMAFICLVWLSSCKSGELNAKLISKDSAAIYTFTNDSLYIDNKESGCPLFSYKLVKIGDSTFKATSVIHDPYHEEDSISHDTIRVRKLPTPQVGWLTHYEVSIGNDFKDTVLFYNAYVHTAI